MKPIVSIDDGSAYDLHVAELLAKYDVHGIFYIPGTAQLSPYDIQELSKQFEIGGHTQTHPRLTRVDESRGRWEILSNKHNLEDIIGKPVTKFAYPRGYNNEHIQSWVKDAGYTEARVVTLFNYREPVNPYATHPTVQIYNGKVEYSGQSWVELAVLYYEKAKAEANGRFELFGHGWEIEEQNLWKTLGELLGQLAPKPQSVLSAMDTSVR